VSTSDPNSDADPLAELAEEFAERYRQGQRPALTEYTDRYPLLADRIRKLFPALVVMEEFGSVAGPDSAPPGTAGRDAPRQLGEYRILREVGRGGMGVVYEAVQESLGRHVALKVLPAQNWKSSVPLERFRREARAVAQLHHTNIVPVFGVGECDGIHYYAMQFIHGQSLDNVLHELKRLRLSRSAGAGADDPRHRTALSNGIAKGMLTGRFPYGDPTATCHLPPGQPDDVSSRTPPFVSWGGKSEPGKADGRQTTAPGGGSRSDLTTRSDAEYARGVARVGVQAAEALEYAHDQGIYHRDVKPSNLLLDTHGTIWLTDFGLAKADDSGELTGDGDIVGTIRYMAPERFRGKADRRSDVYSLGLTLYEMLTLRPAFDDTDRPRLMECIAHKNPAPPRQIDPQIPRDLETVILTAIAKEPDHRYTTAAALAEDLRLFLADRPIRARRTTWVEHGWRWCRRNPALAGLLTAVASLLVGLVVVLGVTNARISGALEQEKQARDLLEQSLYYQWIAAASDARDEHQNARAEEDLNRCPPRFRGWEWHYLKRLPFATLPVWDLGDTPILGMAFSPDDRMLAAGDVAGRVSVRDARTGQVILAPFQAQEQFVRGVAFSPDSRYLATGGHDDRVKLWDPRSGELVREFPTDGRAVLLWLVFSPNGKHLAASDQDRKITVWEVETAARTTLDSPDPLAIRGLAYSADGRLLSLSTDGMVTAWDVATRAPTPLFDAGSHGVNGFVFSPDRRLVALGSEDGTVRVLRTDPWAVLWSLEAHTGPVHGLAFGSGGDRLASCTPGMTVRFWDMRTGQEALSADVVGQRWNSLIFSPDGHRLAAGSVDGQIRILDGTPLDGPGDGGQVLTLDGHRHSVARLAYSPVGRRIASASWDGSARLFDAGSGRELRTLFVGNAPLTGVSFSRDGRRVATSGWDGSVRVFDTETGAEPYPPLRADRAGPVYAVEFDPEDRSLVSAHHDGTVRVWDVETGRQQRTVEAHDHPVLGMAFSRDGRLLVTSGGKQHQLMLWKWAADSQVAVRPLKTTARGVLRNPTFSRDGMRVAVVTGRRHVWLWDVTTGELVESEGKPFDIPGVGNVNQAHFHPDGRRLVVVDEDRVHLLDPETGEVSSVPAAHAGDIGCAVLSPDGKYLATGAGYRGRGEVRIWDLARWGPKP
jgi:WD40 repeat protein/serine/threonine protein kinase